MAILREWAIVRGLDDPEQGMVIRRILPANLPGAEDYMWSEADTCAMPVAVIYRDQDTTTPDAEWGAWIETRHPAAKTPRST